MLRAWGAELGVGMGVSARIGDPGDDAEPLFDADFIAGRFRVRGTSIAGEADFRMAIGGSPAPTGHLLIGPYLAPAAPELVADGSFTVGIGDWQTNGDPLAIVDGELQVTGIGGNTTSAFLPINPIVASSGKAYRLSGKVRRGTTGSVHLGLGSPFSTQNYAGTPSIGSTSMVAVELFCGGFHASNAAIAVRHNGNPSNGTFFADDISLREVSPLAGFVAGELRGHIEATAPEAGGVERILFQADDNADYNNAPVERNYIRLVWDAEGHLRFVVSFGGTGSQVEQVNLDLGSVAPGAAFAVAFSAGTNDFKAALLGQPMQSDTSGAFPGLAVLRFGKGRSNADRLWTGSIDRVRFYPHARTDNEFLAMI